MNLLEQTKYLISKINLRPNKLKGQNFCVSETVLKRMVEVAEVSSADTILEVGAGFGFLTTELLAKAEKVVAVELEKSLFSILKNLAAVNQNLTVIEGDILRISNFEFRISNDGFKIQNSKLNQNSKLEIKNYKIVANLPYSITSVFLKKFLTSGEQPQSMTLLVQKEVAERICAKPGQMSLLAVSVQLYGTPRIVEIIGPENFWPSPRVASAILKISDIHPYLFNQEAPEKVFWQVLRSGFAGKRKQLHHNLQSSLHLTKEQAEKIFTQAKIDKRVRAQELSVENWLKLAKIFYQTIN